MDDVTTIQVASLSDKQARERIVAFAQRFGSGHVDLAAHAAFPLVLTPDLLYRLWAGFLPHIPWTTVADILLSSLCREVGYELYEMDPAIRDILFRRLRQDPRFGEKRLRELAGFLEEYILLSLNGDDPHERNLAEAQHLTALAQTAPGLAAREIAARLSDPSRLKGAELLRLATLTESLSQQLGDYSPLVSYARGVERLAHGDRRRGSELLERAFAGKPDLKIVDVTLQRPRPAPDVRQEPVLEETARPVAQETQAPGAPKIFISYRRSEADSSYIVGAIHERLAQVFGKDNVFRDTYDIAASTEWRSLLDREVNSCNVMLVLIGPNWANVASPSGEKRLFDTNDVTRWEVETGLRRSREENVVVIPVLTTSAEIPREEDLPESIRQLLDKNVIRLRDFPDFDRDIERLIWAIRRIPRIEPETAPLTRQISLKPGVNVRAVNITEDREIQGALTQLEIPHPKSVIVLVGGANEIGWLDQFPVRKAIRIIVRLAEQTQSVVVDGGTQAGMMKEIGKQRQQSKFSFPLIGVVLDSLLMQEEPESILDSNHTHFFLIPGEDWGDESAWISKIATVIAGDQKSVTVLINGGDISKSDIEYSLLENRPTYVMRGTGGMADEITLTDKVIALNISQNPDKILEFLKARLVDIQEATPAAEQAQRKAKIFIAYARSDVDLREFLAERLSALGHTVFNFETNLGLTENWQARIEQEIETSDFVIALLSESSVNSQSVQFEIQHAIDYQKRGGIPKVLPVLVGNLRELPLSLGEIQSASWRSEEDNERLVQQLARAIQGEWPAIEPPETSPVMTAEEFYLRLIPEEQVTMRRIFLKLVRPGEGSQLISNPMLRTELYQAAEASDRIDRVLIKLIDARLLRTYQQAGAVWLEVADEALIRSWPRLVEWLEEESSPRTFEGGAAGIDRSQSRQAEELLERLKQEFRVEINRDWGGSAAAWQPGTWTLADLDKLYRTLALMADLMGGSAAFIQNLGGVSVRKSDIGSHGGEALAHRVSFTRRAPLSAWTIVHEFAHAWDANSGWRLSRELERLTGGSTNRVRSATTRLLGNWDAGPNGPENKPGRYGRLPGCNKAGYFYGDKPSGSNWHFNRVEDFAESVGMYLGMHVGGTSVDELSEHAHKRIERYLLKNGERDAFGIVDNWADYAKYFYPENGDYTKTKRWQFIDDLVKRRRSAPS